MASIKIQTYENREGECLDHANVRIKLFSINRVLARPY